jgi:hypothetical protein
MRSKVTATRSSTTCLPYWDYIDEAILPFKR